MRSLQEILAPIIRNLCIIYDDLDLQQGQGHHTIFEDFNNTVLFSLTAIVRRALGRSYPVIYYFTIKLFNSWCSLIKGMMSFRHTTSHASCPTKSRPVRYNYQFVLETSISPTSEVCSVCKVRIADLVDNIRMYQQK